MLRFKHRGNFKKTDRFLKGAKNLSYSDILTKYGEVGVAALSSATPIDTGETASSWGFEIEKNSDGYAIYWTNTHIEQGVPIAIILQYGHGTGTGGYVEGRDYINPALKPIFDVIAEDAWKEVRNL